MGAEASNLISEAALALEMGAMVEDLALTWAETTDASLDLQAAGSRLRL